MASKERPALVVALLKAGGTGLAILASINADYHFSANDSNRPEAAGRSLSQTAE